MTEKVSYPFINKVKTSFIDTPIIEEEIDDDASIR